MKPPHAKLGVRAALLIFGAGAAAGIGCDGIKYVPEEIDSALPAEAASPRIVFDALAHDFGTVAAGAALTHTFTFSNRGQGVLELRQPKGS